MQRLLARLWNLETRLGLVVGLFTAALLLFIWNNGLFIQSQLQLNDLFFVASETTDHVILIALDNATHNAYGRSLAAWPRTVYADLITKLNEGQARVVAFDILFDQPSEHDQEVVDAITKARQSETRTRFIMPQVGADQILTQPSTFPSLNFNNTLYPIPAFSEVVDYVGYVNAFTDVDSIVRRQISLVDNRGTTRISFDIAAYLAWLRIPAAALDQVVKPAPEQLQVAKLTIPVDEHGLWQQNFFDSPASSRLHAFPVYSALDVINGKITPKAFQDKLVLVGLMNTTAATDLYPVPSSTNGQLMAGVEIHAHAIESLLQDKIPHAQSRPMQAIMIASIAIIASLIYTRFKWYWMLPAAGLMVVVLFVIGSVQFSKQLEFINLFYGVLALIIPLIISVFIDVGLEVSRRNKAEFLLGTSMEVSSQRMAIDRIVPSIANDIQRVLKAPTGAIWLLSQPTSAMTLKHQWGNTNGVMTNLELLATRAQHDQKLVREQNCAAIPVIWQKRLIAILGVQLPRKGWFPSASRIRLITTLADHIAPNLDNATLYTRTEDQNALLEAILGGSPAAIIVLTPDFKLIKTNKAVATDLPEAGEVATGLDFFALLDRLSIDPATQESIRNQFQTNTFFRHELKLGKKVFNLDVAKVDFGDWVIIFNDVTALAEVNRLKTQMVRMTSHDLKKPLSRVLGYGSLLLDDPNKDALNVQQRQFLQRIFQAGEEMLELINDILDLEQIRSSHIKTKLVSVQTILKDVTERYRPDMEGKHQTIQQEIASDAPEVIGDPLLLSQALSNLLENAVKYTPESGTITTRLCQHDKFLRIEIEDTGFGIPESAQSQLFQEFYRVRTRNTAHISGTGLGLSLARSIIEAHYGRIGVKSQEGVGSTFFIEIPIPQET